VKTEPATVRPPGPGDIGGAVAAAQYAVQGLFDPLSFQV